MGRHASYYKYSVTDNADKQVIHESREIKGKIAATKLYKNALKKFPKPEFTVRLWISDKR